MSAKMEENLSYEDIGHLLDAKAEKLKEGSEDPEVVIREVMETLARSESVRSREKAVDQSGRVSLGRDLTGTYGISLFQPDPSEVPDDEGDETEDDGEGGAN